MKKTTGLRAKPRKLAAKLKSPPGINKQKMQALLAGEGVSIQALCEATGWLSEDADVRHVVREAVCE